MIARAAPAEKRVRAPRINRYVSSPHKKTAAS